MDSEFPSRPEELALFAERLFLIPPGSDTGVVVRDQHGLVTSANLAAETILGLSLTQMRGLAIEELLWSCVDEEGWPVPVTELPAALALERGEPTRGRVLGLFRRSPDGVGEHVWLEVSAEPLYGSEDDRPLAVVSTFTVIAGGRNRQLQNAYLRHLWHAVTQNITDVLVLAAADGTAVWTSTSMRRTLGHDPQDVVGRSVLDFVHPDDAKAAGEEFAAILAGAHPTAKPWRVRHADGHYVWAEISAKAVTDDARHPAQVLASMRDVSARISLERDRDLAIRRFEMAMRYAPDGILIASTGGVLLEVNDAFAQFVGIPATALVGRRVIDIVAPEHREDSADTITRLLTGQPQSMTAERAYLHADGTLVWARRSVTVIRDDASGEPLYFLTQLKDITERKRLQKEMATLVMTDTLTGLPNRLVLMERLSHAITIARRDGTRIGVLLCDLDMFKYVNDTFGRTAGDDVLRQVGARLTAAVRPEDTAIRLGGDEFVVVCENVTDVHDVARVAARIAAEVGRPYTFGDEQVELSVSIGIAVGDGPTAEELLARADAAMYRSKNSVHDRVSVYEDAAHADAIDRLALETELHTAVARDELRLFYQPVIDLADGGVAGYEALIRWQHPTLGILPPGRFLPAAEHSRLIVTIGNWVLNRGCVDAAAWTNPVTVAVNISARHLARADFPTTVRETLERTGLDPARLWLEITESSVLHASQSSLTSTNALLDLGVRLSLDDFGTGQSSVATLHKLRLNAIKIDRSFIADLLVRDTAANLVDGLIHLGKGLGLDVVAEGIETHEQSAWLIEHHCPHGQGLFYSRPEPLGSDGQPAKPQRHFSDGPAGRL